MKRVVVAIMLAACGGGDPNGPNPDATLTDGGGGDAPPSCGVNVTFEPPMPYAFPGARVRAVVHVTNAPGVLSYTWEVKRNGTMISFTSAAPDMSAVDFDTSTAESYEATVVIGGTSETCPVQPSTVNVLVPGANSTQVRMRVYPPSNVAAPPNEKLVLISGGANQSVGIVTIDPGVLVGGTTSAQAYLRFIPVVARDAYVEAFASVSGQFTVRVLNQPHDVLVVPLVAGFAPKVITNWLPGSNLPLDAGTAITGVVRDQTNAVVGGAKVQLVVGGVPTTLATTDGAGAFSVRTSVVAGAASIEVTPPTSSGLPRLVANAAFDLSQPVQIKYDAGIAIRDLAGAVVRRSGTAQPNAVVAIVGTFAAGTVTTGAIVAGATGEVRATATANGSGVLPLLRAPDENLFAVVATSSSDVTMSGIDLRGAVPATVDAPVMTSRTVQLRNTASAPLPGAVLEAMPRGVLAMSGLGTVRVVADGNGDVIAGLAPGATYDFHFADPRGHEIGRSAGPKAELDKTALDLPSAYVLPKGLEVKGSLALAGNPQPVGNAAVQILCAVGGECTAATRVFPLAEGASSSVGAFAVAVTDPGTMLQ